MGYDSKKLFIPSNAIIPLNKDNFGTYLKDIVRTKAEIASFKNDLILMSFPKHKVDPINSQKSSKKFSKIGRQIEDHRS